MLMLSIYVYLLWGWRRWELSNILVKCLEDLRIKLKPAEVSCKSCSALLGPMSCTVCGLQWNIPLGKPRSTQCCWLPLAPAGAWLAPSGYYSATGKSLLACCQGRNVAVPPRPCLQHHRKGYLCPEWEQAEPGVSQLLLQSQGDEVSGSAVVQAAGAFLSELARVTGVPGFGCFHLCHGLTLIQLAST